MAQKFKKCTKCRKRKCLNKFGIYKKRNPLTLKEYRHNYCKKCRNKHERFLASKIRRKKKTRYFWRKNESATSLKGKKFGMLTVIKFVGMKPFGDRRAAFFLCQCECGNKKEMAGTCITRRNSPIKSCGCLYFARKREKNGNWTGCGELSGTYLHILKRNARIRNIKFKVSKEYLWNLFLKQNKKCALSGINLVMNVGSKVKGQTASLDRIDSSKAYIKGNLQWIHKDINLMKMNLNQDRFIQLCSLIKKKNN